MCHSSQFKFAEVEKDSFDFRSVFENVKPFIESADLAIGNFETTTSGENRGYSGYPIFNTPDEFLDALKFSGFDLLITSNNHILDKRESGLQRTQDEIIKREMDYIGTYNSVEDYDSLRFYEVDGFRLALFAYTYGTNIPEPKGKNFLVRNIDTTLIKFDIEKARAQNPDAIIICFHFGNEYKRDASKFQREIVNKTIEYGADIILGSHPHVMQPIEIFKTNSGSIDSGFVAYSLGNFVSNQQWRYSDAGVILNFTLEKSDSLRVKKINFIPTWVYKGNTGQRNQFIIYPSELTETDSLPEYFKKNEIEKMRESYFDTIEILRKRSDFPVVKSILDK